MKPSEVLQSASCPRQDEHRTYSRRGFLRNLGLVGGGALVLGQLEVNALGFSPLTAALTSGSSDRVLVLVRLTGGNDGLNTFVPLHDFGTYQAARPDLHLARTEVIGLNSTTAMHPAMTSAKKMWNEGKMRVVQNVGYPAPNLSHFRSSDIWATASDSDELIGSGVLGRYLSGVYPDYLSSPPAVPPAIQIGGQGNLIFNNDDDFNYAVSTRNPTQLYEIARTGRLYSIDNLPDCSYGEQLGYLRAVANTTFRYAGVLAETFDAGRNQANYLDDELGSQLALIARMLKGGLGTRLFVVELDGFDTHANQPDQHATLLKSVSNNVSAFFEDLSKADMDQRVLAMSFSEFGRRLHQNGSAGTDHGAAAPMMLFGPALEGNGITGGVPDLQDLDDDFNLKYKIDYRSVYATVLGSWLCIDEVLVDELLGGRFERIGELGLQCNTTGVAQPGPIRPDIGLEAYLSGSEIVVSYRLSEPAATTIHFYDATGRLIATPFQGRQPAGHQQHRFDSATLNWSSGIYIVGVEAGARVYSRKVALFRR